MVETAVTAAISCLVTTGIGVIIGVLRERLKHANEEESALKEGMKYLLKDRIHTSSEHWLELEYCPLRSKKVITEMASIYYRLGGNDFVHEEVEEVMDLPISKQED